MRGLAAQIVLIGHSLNIFLPGYFMRVISDGGLEARPNLLYIQNLGVLLFFYLSGFLVTSSAMRIVSNGGNFPEFFADRFSRIFTPLIPLLLIVWFLDNFYQARGLVSPYTVANSGIADLILNALVLAGNPVLSKLANVTGLPWMSSTSFGTADQLWTVILEWWIYMVFGAILFIPMRRVTLGATAVGGMVALGLLGATYIVGTWLNAPGLILAWLVGLVARLGYNRFRAIPKLAVCVWCFVAAFVALYSLLATNFEFYNLVVSGSAGGLFFGIYFCFCDRGALRRSLKVSALIDYLSRISYSLYLVQFSVIIYLALIAPSLVGNWRAVLIAFFLSNIAAWLFYMAFERHYRLIREALDPVGRKLELGRVRREMA